MAGFKKLLLGLSAFLAAAPALFGLGGRGGQDFDPERHVSVSLKDGAVVLSVPRGVAHASEIAVGLKSGAPGKLTVGALPRPSGKDALGSDYWAGDVRIPVRGEGLRGAVTLVVSYAACMEGEGGLCFPPVDRELNVMAEDIPGYAAPQAGSADRAAGAPGDAQAAPAIRAAPVEAVPAAQAVPAVGGPWPPISPDLGSPDASGAPGAPGVSSAPDAPGASDAPGRPSSKGGLLAVLVLFFLGGIGASLTPCVLPMIPITMAVIGARGAKKSRGMLLGVALTQGMALTYTALGVAAALTGAVFGQFAQRPAFLVPVAAVFALLAMSLFGAFEIRLPESWAARLQSSGPRKGFLGAFVMGLVLGPLSAPCVGPLIGAAIVDIGVNRQVFEGALKMFIFAQGMGVLFVLGGTAVSALPKSGDWLIRFKQTLGLVILAFAAWTLRLIVPEWANFAMWSIVVLLASGVYGAFEPAAGLVQGLRRGLALFALALAVLLGLRSVELGLGVQLLPRGAAAAERPADDLWIEHDLEEARDRARYEGKLVLVDTFTSWCAQCKELDEKTWPDAAVRGWIKRNAVAVRIDTEKVRPDLAGPLGVAAYPTTILLSPDGREVRRILGFHGPEKMLEWLER